MNKYEKQDGKNLFLCCAKGVLAALMTALALLMLASALAMTSSDPVSSSGWGYGIFLFCSAVGGFVSGKKYGKSRPVCGLISGVIYTACVLCASVLTLGEPFLWLLPPASLLCSVIGGTVGGMGILSPSPRRVKHKSNFSFNKSKNINSKGLKK